MLLAAWVNWLPVEPGSSIDGDSKDIAAGPGGPFSSIPLNAFASDSL